MIFVEPSFGSDYAFDARYHFEPSMETALPPSKKTPPFDWQVTEYQRRRVQVHNFAIMPGSVGGT